MWADSFAWSRRLALILPRRFRRGYFAHPPLLGYLDEPFWRADLLVVRGWIHSRGTAIRTLHLRAANREVPVPTGLDRPDVARALPAEPAAARAGFALAVAMPGDVAAIEIWATLDGGRRVLAFRARVDPPVSAPASVDAVRPSAPGGSPRGLPADDGGDAPWPDLDLLLAGRPARIIVELDARSPASSTIATAQRVAPGAIVYLVGTGLGPPDHRPAVCVLDRHPSEALRYFADGTVDVILARGRLPREWEAKLRPGALVLHAGKSPPIVVPERVAPAVSIVIPVHGKAELTRRCLRSLAARASAIEFEVIVVDDASPDGSAGELARHQGIRLISLAKNVGFGQACNQGADAARGRFLVFLNNDTEVTDGWLEALYQTFVDEPAAGLVGAKLVFPNGTVHEAGSLIFRDGSAMNCGRGEDPDHPSWNVVRDADYCSAACIMIRADVFKQLGGFDPLYAPAYYEDSDLAFRVRQLGLRVLYQPFAAIIHHEGGTSGTDVRRGVKRFQVLNQDKFRTRWETTLAGYPERPPDHLAVDSRRRGTGRILVIDHWVPSPDRDSGSVRMDRLLTLLQSAGLEVTFTAPRLHHTGAGTERLQRRGVEVLYAPWVPSVRAHLAEQGRRYDMVLLSRRDPAELYLADVRELAPQAAVAFDTVDLHFVRESRAAELARDDDALSLARQRGDAELALMRRSDVTVVVSSADARWLASEHGIRNTVVISNVHDNVATEVPPFDARRDLVFVGYFAHAPNTDGIMWFVREVLPIVQARLPGVGLHVIGAEPPEELRRASSHTVHVHGRVSDLERYLDAARVMVAPLRYGAGVKGKITQSLSRGLPVVGTTVAAEGMEVIAGVDLLVADTPAAFADAVEQLYRNEGLWTELSQRGRDVARQHYSVEAAAAGVAQLVRHLSAGRVQRTAGSAAIGD
jgi:GT2 family glycosyltransferase